MWRSWLAMYLGLEFIIVILNCVDLLKRDQKGLFWFWCLFISDYLIFIFVNVDMFMGFDENDGDDDIREEFLCPFCSEYFDIVGLCCHIDEEHPMEARNGVWLLSFTSLPFSCIFEVIINQCGSIWWWLRLDDKILSY